LKGGVTPEVIAEVRARANILDVVSEQVPLKKRGKDHWGLCPFHNEKTGSFSVNQDKGIYKCFGCGEGGDSFAFVQKVKGLNFIDAVRELAHRYGVPLVESAEQQAHYDKRSQILMLYQQASEYYMKMLQNPGEGMAAREYLKNRGLTEETIAKFKLGYAPNTWDGLLTYLTRVNQVSASTLEEAGLVRKRTEGTGHIDLFRERLMVPICDDQGRVIAFGGRAFGDSPVKYLNSPETPLYTKGQHLFAFHLAKEAIKAKDAVIVVEGYFDVITPHQYGFENTVATCGTALTAQQAKMLIRYTESKRVYLSFDSDAAGVKAVERGVETLTQVAEGVGIQLRVIDVPGSKDPDECLRSEGGPEAFQQAINDAPLLTDYQIAQQLKEINYQTHTGKIEAAKRVVPVIARIRSDVARGEYIRQTAMKIGIREEELLTDVGQYRRENRLANSSGRSPFSMTERVPLTNKVAHARMRDGILGAERSLLALFLLSRDDHKLAWEALVDEQFLTPAHVTVKEAIYGIGTSFNNIEDLQHRIQDRLAPEKDAAAALVEVILTAEEMRKQNAPAGVIILESRTRLVKARIDRLVQQLKAASGSEIDERNQVSLQSKISELTKLEKIVLPQLGNISELDDLKRKIDQLVGQSENNSLGEA